MKQLTWRELQEVVTECTEEEVVSLLIDEVTLYKRPHIIVRLHQRYARLRADRERQEILRAAQV